MLLALSRLEKLEKVLTIAAALVTVVKVVKELRHVEPPPPQEPQRRKRGEVVNIPAGVFTPAPGWQGATFERPVLVEFGRLMATVKALESCARVASGALAAQYQAEQDREAAVAQLVAATEALGVAWMVGSGTLAEAIQRKCSALEELAHGSPQ